MMWWNHGAWGAGDWLAMSLTMLVFWGLLFATVVLLVRGFKQGPTSEPREGQPPRESADEVLAGRFARGEIDAEEFERRREVLHTTKTS